MIRKQSMVNWCYLVDKLW